jgi:ribosomal protein S19
VTRSLKKNPFVATHLLRKIEKLKTKEEKEILKTWSRASTIIPAMIGHIITTSSYFILININLSSLTYNENGRRRLC